MKFSYGRAQDGPPIEHYEFDEAGTRRHQPCGLRSPLHISLLLALLLSSNVFTFYYSTRFRAPYPSFEPTSQDVNEAPVHRGFFSDIDDQYHLHNFSAFAWKPNKYTAPASKAVDEAWAALGIDYNFFLIPAESSSEFSLTRDHIYFTEETSPDGHEGFPANMEALHQLHCVNEVRKALYYNHDYYADQTHTHPTRATGNEVDIDITHTNHCLDMLRELVMCRAEANVVPYFWATREGDTMPDFAREKQCRDFDSVRAWAERHQATVPEDFTRVTPPEVRLFDELYP